MLLNKLEAINNRWEDVGEQITRPEIITDQKKYVNLTREYKELGYIVEAYKEYKNIVENIESSKEVIATEEDEDFKEMAKAELEELEPKKLEMEDQIKVLLIPKDPEDAKNIQMELRAGTGGDEASIFAGDLMRMYTKYAEKKGWRVEIVDTQDGTSGGYKEVIMDISGDGVYGILKFESGVHRVQRVPQTETQGRVHTSAATVMVLPEAEEFDVEISKNDIRKDLYCASGPGGQSVNTTYSAVRLTHIPSGIVAQCQDQKSQHKNYDKALKVLRSRIYDMELQKKLAADSITRKSLVSSGDRSAKIRTYNYSQGRVTDHRINLTLYNLSAIIDGDLEDVSEALIMADNAEKLKEGTENLI